ncbi:TPA: hypothetical protein ACQVKY_005615 [Serratia marcescens]|uniref:Uncharacterized protein n=1 Tax=Serratia nevei TaxID=2703794 RepID=A0ABT7G5Y7_9GAMM|nr:hypothetical protein [Serratia nevei]HAU4290831.1 hypothetical protein [Serratia marcescens]MDK5169001.1 hypothetical protein [Serratia nevei]MDK5298495.1 hypothetical protein [Serratia nevei]MEC5887253.1 hypothetical protein [Serratia nevei]HAU4297515.1 hypothetical protein [Serratia marcescens]
MNNYNDKEIEVMSDDELGQFLGIANKMLEKAKSNQTKAMIALDQAQSLYNEINECLRNRSLYDWENPCPYSSENRKSAASKVDKLEFKLKELKHEIFYLQRTIGRGKVELGSRESIKAKAPSFSDRWDSELNDLFGEV